MAVAVVCALFLLPATAAGGYYALLALAGRPSRPRPVVGPLPRLTVLVPAHNEQLGLPTALESVFAADYPPGRVRVLVVADNCTDQTAAVARRAGAEVLERNDPGRRGKGYAVATGLAHALTTGADAVLIVDADCAVDRSLLTRVGGELANGADAVQAAVVSRPDPGSPGGYVAAVGGAVDAAVAAGQDRLGLSVPLRGTGMAFGRALLARHPWSASGVTEDAEYSAVLRRAGVRVRFVADAAVRCAAPPRPADFAVQRRRWRAALRVPGGGATALVASKPLVLAHLLLTVVAVAAFAPHLLGWAGGLVAVTAAVYGRAIASVGLPRPGVFVRSVGLVGRLGLVALGGFWERDVEWHRTPRS